jgi:hypothetical protein
LLGITNDVIPQLVAGFKVGTMTGLRQFNPGRVHD